MLANELGRSLGQADVYPLSLTQSELRKLFFIERVIKSPAACSIGK